MATGHLFFEDFSDLEGPESFDLASEDLESEDFDSEVFDSEDLSPGLSAPFAVASPDDALFSAEAPLPA